MFQNPLKVFGKKKIQVQTHTDTKVPSYEGQFYYYNFKLHFKMYVHQFKTLMADNNAAGAD